MNEPHTERHHHGLWAQFRFAVIGGLLAHPPKRGRLKNEIDALAERHWEHPITKEPTTYRFSTIEHWYYAARKSNDPIAALRPKVRRDAGTHKSLTEEVRVLLREQYEKHKTWSYQLHADNLAVECEQQDKGEAPSYSSVLRYMKAYGLLRHKRRRAVDTEGARRASERLRNFEVRSYEASYVNQLWHLDYHECSRSVLLRDGTWTKPVLLCVMDDYSRLVCHAQWYLQETCENLVHGYSQACQKRELPRSTMSDNGSAMKAAEFREGLEGDWGLSIVHELTLEYSPYQNAKQEFLFSVVEGRLIPMLEGVGDLTLELLNEATHAWFEMEYHRKVHSETGETPLDRFLHGRNVARPCPGSGDLRRCFMATLTRRQRKSDGTVSVHGTRFEVPSRFRTMERLVLRCARWDLSAIDLVDPREKVVLAKLFPLDKTKNADGQRRRVTPLLDDPSPTEAQEGDGEIAPLLKKLMGEYSATGVPPGFIPKDDTQSSAEAEDDELAACDQGALPDLPPWEDPAALDELTDEFDDIPF